MGVVTLLPYGEGDPPYIPDERLSMSQVLNGAVPTSEAVDQMIEALVTPLLAERDQLLAYRDEITSYRDKATANISRIDKMLKAAGYNLEPLKPGKKQSSGRRGLGPVALQIVTYAAEQTEPVTAASIKAGMGLAQSTGAIKKLLDAGRDAGLLRVAGQTQSTGKGRGSTLFAALPDSIERLKALAADASL